MEGNYFEMFGLPAGFDVDEAALTSAWRVLQTQYHPDYHALAEEWERLVALQRSALANKAYQVLREPISRAAYLLLLQGYDVYSFKPDSCSAFLEKQLSLQERLSDALISKNVSACVELEAYLKHLANEYEKKFSLFAKQQEWSEAMNTMYEWIFIDKLMLSLRKSLISLNSVN